MYALSEHQDLQAFKERLKETRRKSIYKQDQLAEALHFSGRSSISNWESNKSKAVPTLEDFVNLCILLKVDPNYLLGMQDFEVKNDHLIAEETGLSDTGVRRLRGNKEPGRLFDYMLACPEFSELQSRMKQVYHYGIISEAQETTFWPRAWKRIQKAFKEFYRDVFPLDMNADHFAVYVRKEFDWCAEDMDIDRFINSVITENEYQNILFDTPDFESKTDAEKYDILIRDIANTSYDYLMAKPILELAEGEITKLLDSIVKGFLNEEIIKFKRRSK